MKNGLNKSKSNVPKWGLGAVEAVAGIERGSPSWYRVVGIFLMLPIGIIIALVLFYFVAFRGRGIFPGEFLIILLVICLGVVCGPNAVLEVKKEILA